MSTKIYSIPAKFRKIENLHILLWLLKDTCWAMTLRIPGIIMIIPTLTVALLITWQTRHLNLWHGFGLRHFALVPFACGLGVLIYYYIFYRNLDLKEENIYLSTSDHEINQRM
jgi:hypothetical protein